MNCDLISKQDLSEVKRTLSVKKISNIELRIFPMYIGIEEFGTETGFGYASLRHSTFIIRYSLFIISSCFCAFVAHVPSRIKHPESRFSVLHFLGRIVFLLAVFTSGCGTPQAPTPVQDYYYLNPHKTLTAIGRVVIVELDNDSNYAQISTDVTETLFQALQKKQVFGLTVVHRHDPSWRGLWLEGDSTFDLNQILTIRDTLKCDGLLLGTITEFRPYPHMAIGLRLKLLDLTDGQLVWALEQVWDSTDKSTEKHIKNYFKSKKGSGLAPLYEKLAVVSPLEFVKFVSCEVAETL